MPIELKTEAQSPADVQSETQSVSQHRQFDEAKQGTPRPAALPTQPRPMTEASNFFYIKRIHPIQNPILQLILPTLSKAAFSCCALGFQLLVTCTGSKIILKDQSRKNFESMRGDQKIRIYLPNHVSNFDPVVLTTVLLLNGIGRVCSYYKSEFDHNLITWILALFGGHISTQSTRAILSTATTPEEKTGAYQETVNRLSEQTSVRLDYYGLKNFMMFLEGTRSKVPSGNPDAPFKMLNAQTGCLEATIQAAKRIHPNEVDIVPVGLKQQGRFTFEVNFGQPIPISTVEREIQQMGDIRTYANHLIKTKIAPLSGQDIATEQEINETRRLRNEKRQRESVAQRQRATEFLKVSKMIGVPSLALVLAAAYYSQISAPDMALI